MRKYSNGNVTTYAAWNDNNEKKTLVAFFQDCKALYTAIFIGTHIKKILEICDGCGGGGGRSAVTGIYACISAPSRYQYV